MSMTPRLSMPFLAPGQAQKELYHNEALQILDTLVAAAVEQPPLSTPPAAPVVGSSYIVGSSPAGEWSGYSQHFASFTEGGWRFIAPRDGMVTHVRSSGATAVYKSGIWEIGTLVGSKLVIEGQQVVGQRAAAIEAPTSGSLIDVEARTTISQILIALRQHGLVEM